MRVHLVNPSHLSFGIAVITPRWLYVLAAATPPSWGDPMLCDETITRFDASQVRPGDVIGIGIHTGNALRGYAIGKECRARGASVVFGGIHATLFPEESIELGSATAVVRGDGDRIWASVLAECRAGIPRRIYEAGRISADALLPARWDLLPAGRYLWASVQTVRGCPKHCSFCSVWRTDGQAIRQRPVADVVAEVVELRRRGFRFIALADDNFYPVTLRDIELASRRADTARLDGLKRLRAQRFELLRRLADLPEDMVFFTQITVEAAEDPSFLDAMARARIRGGLVGIESVTPEGLKDIHKGFNPAGDELVERLRRFRRHGVYVLGSFIFGLPSDGPTIFDATLELAERAQLTFAQFVMLTPFPGTVDFERWEREVATRGAAVGGIPMNRHWLIPEPSRPKMFTEHPVMSPNEIRAGTQRVWDRFYSIRHIWTRSRVAPTIRGRLAFVLISKLYRQMYANTGITTDSGRVERSTRMARRIGLLTRRLFSGKPMPELTVPP